MPWANFVASEMIIAVSYTAFLQLSTEIAGTIPFTSPAIPGGSGVGQFEVGIRQSCVNLRKEEIQKTEHDQVYIITRPLSKRLVRYSLPVCSTELI